MHAITLDDDLKARFNGLNEYMEIHDQSGKLIGHFMPEEMYQRWEARRRQLAGASDDCEPPVVVVGVTQP